MSGRPKPTVTRNGISLIELLVVIAIIGVLLALVLTVIQAVRARAARLQDEANFRQVCLAVQSYQETYHRLPPLIGKVAVTPSETWPLPVAAFLLPYLEQSDAATLLKRSPPDYVAPYHAHVVPVYVSPNDPSHTKGRVILNDQVQPGVGNVAFNVQVFGSKLVPGVSIDGRANLAHSFPDGTSNTVIVASKRGKCGPDLPATKKGGSYWMSAQVRGYVTSTNIDATLSAMFGYALPDAEGNGPTFQVRPGEQACDPEQPQGLIAGGITVGMADGSVRMVRAGINPKLWRAGLLPNDGAALPSE